MTFIQFDTDAISGTYMAFHYECCCTRASLGVQIKTYISCFTYIFIPATIMTNLYLPGCNKIIIEKQSTNN